MDNATSTNKNRYLLGWAMEIVQHGLFNVVWMPFLMTGHSKFAPDRLFASVANLYNKMDVFSCKELIEITTHYATGRKETGVNVLKWREILDKIC